MARSEGRLDGRPRPLQTHPPRRDGHRGAVRAHLQAAPARVPGCRYVPLSVCLSLRPRDAGRLLWGCSAFLPGGCCRIALYSQQTFLPLSPTLSLSLTPPLLFPAPVAVDFAAGTGEPGPGGSRRPPRSRSRPFWEIPKFAELCGGELVALFIYYYYYFVYSLKFQFVKAPYLAGSWPKQGLFLDVEPRCPAVGGYANIINPCPPRNSKIQLQIKHRLLARSAGR